MGIIELAIVSLMVILILVGIIVSYQSEKRDWNNGICEESGMKWKHFDTASDGSFGFTDGQGNYIWISFKSIIKE